MTIKEFKVDLHIHTCLSPCADNEMTPKRIITQAKKMDLDVIGICDHNASENVEAVSKAGKKQGIYVLQGMEITSSEEVHVMSFFEKRSSLQEMQHIVYDNLSGENDVDAFGEQIIVDENDVPVGINNKLLFGASQLNIDKVVELIHSFNGIAIASHIDRESHSIIGQLGFIPEGISFDAVEISSACGSEKRKDLIFSNQYTITSSDAHFISDIGSSYTIFYMETPCFSEIKMALNQVYKRTIKI